MGITPHQRAKNKAAQEAADFNDNNDFRSPVRPCLISKKGGRLKRQAHTRPVTSPIKKNTTERGRDSKLGQEETFEVAKISAHYSGCAPSSMGNVARGGTRRNWF